MASGETHRSVEPGQPGLAWPRAVPLPEGLDLCQASDDDSHATGSGAMFVLIVGCGRVGSAIAKRMISEGHEVSVLDESPESHALLDHGLPQTWEDAGGQFTVGTALEL